MKNTFHANVLAMKNVQMYNTDINIYGLHIFIYIAGKIHEGDFDLNTMLSFL